LRDPSVAFTPSGTGYLTYLAVQSLVGGCSWNNVLVYVRRTLDFGQTWTTCQVVDSGTFPALLDHPWLAATPDGRVYVAYFRAGSGHVVRYLPAGAGSRLS
jgi:hypothetical protein